MGMKIKRNVVIEAAKASMGLETAPNLAALIGEVVGARLISHVGSLTNLAKLPSFTLQILGADERALQASLWFLSEVTVWHVCSYRNCEVHDNIADAWLLLMLPCNQACSCLATADTFSCVF
ncbi:nucleolar protein 56-like protein [Tanacetum coccineum]